MRVKNACGRWGMLGAFPAVLCCALVAAGSPAPGQVLSWREALDLAEASHPRLRAALAELEGSRAAVRTARGFPNPQVAAASGRQAVRVAGNVSGMAHAFAASQLLDVGPVRSSRVSLAEREEHRAALQLELVRLEVLSNARRAFFEALHKKDELELLEDNVRLVQELLRKVSVRVAVGEGARLEAIRAEAEVALASTAANKAQLERVRTLAELRNAIGLPPAAPLDVHGEPDAPQALSPLEVIRAEVVGHHPLLQLGRAEVEAAEARLTHEQALRLPQPSFVTQVDYPPDTPVYLFGFELPVPLWNLRQGPIAEAQAALRRAHEIARMRELELLARLESAYQRYQIANQQVQAIEGALLREAQQALEATEAAYRLGERGLLDVLDAQRVLRTVRLSLVQAIYDRQAALIDLDELRARDPRERTP
ncbi:MAG: TolC family protein [Candidatus Binatia bacterium]|nr:TolC family protein [Candidatus Binatia bacterium]